MHPVIENFLERPLSHKLAFWIGSLLLISGLFWMYGLKGSRQEHTELEERLKNLEVQLYEQRNIARNLPAIKEEVDLLNKKLDMLVLQLPDSKEIDDLLSQISVLAVDTGLEVLKFAPAREIIKDFFAEVPVEVELEGTFHQLATFFDEVGHLSRIVNIKDISIDILQETKKEVLIRTICSIIAFRYLDESERIKVQPAAETGGRKKRRSIS